MREEGLLLWSLYHYIIIYISCIQYIITKMLAEEFWSPHVLMLPTSKNTALACDRLQKCHLMVKRLHVLCTWPTHIVLTLFLFTKFPLRICIFKTTYESRSVIPYKQIYMCRLATVYFKNHAGNCIFILATYSDVFIYWRSYWNSLRSFGYALFQNVPSLWEPSPIFCFIVVTQWVSSLCWFKKRE